MCLKDGVSVGAAGTASLPAARRLLRCPRWWEVGAWEIIPQNTLPECNIVLMDVGMLR